MFKESRLHRGGSVGQFSILEELGVGGMSVAFLARDTAGNFVVLKEMLDPRDDLVLRDETEIGLRLRHPNIVTTLDLLEVDGRPIVVLEYCAGATLRQLRRNGPMPASAVVSIGRQVCDALSFIHEATDPAGRPMGILHRDVSPGNVIVGHDGVVRLIDLGLARFNDARAARTVQGVIKGTVRYLAPELLTGTHHSPASDLWALGVTLWEVTIGRVAVRGDATFVLARILSGGLLQLQQGEHLDRQLLHPLGSLLAEEAECRPPNAREAAGVFEMYEKQLAGGTEVLQDRVLQAVGEERLNREVSDTQIAKFAADYSGRFESSAAGEVDGTVDDLEMQHTVPSPINFSPASEEQVLQVAKTMQVDREALVKTVRRLRVPAELLREARAENSSTTTRTANSAANSQPEAANSQA